MKAYYEGGGVTLYLGDCREVLPALDTASVDLVLTDPPYGIKYDTWDVVLDLRPVVAECWRALRPDAYQLWFWPPGLFPQAFGGLFDHYHRMLVWSKPRTSGVAKHEAILYQMEPILVLKRGVPPYSKAWGMVYRDVIEVPIVQTGMAEYTGHRAQKPLTLIKGLLHRFLASPATVLEPFAGSGTTLVAARICGHRAIGIEIEERYCEIVARRLSQSVLPLFDDVAEAAHV